MFNLQISQSTSRATIGGNLRVWIHASSLVFSLILSATVIGQEAPKSVELNQQVRSLLSNKCFACHGPDEDARESGLRLDTREGAIESAIDLDDPKSSELLARIVSDDSEMVMPPPKHGEPLSTAETELIRNWIEAGATYANHWSYIKPAKPVVSEAPTVGVASNIDHFVQMRLIGSGLSPAKPAGRPALIRRLALDLTGLPPTLEEMERFQKDNSAQAYEKVVDDYLSRPAYGERWAAMWLDLARYADSAGYADDRKRTIWMYRDYVIRAYNENKSFDQFTVEQIAGDLLPEPTEQQRVATAFHRNTLTNSEGGTSDEEFHSAAVVDRVNTTLAVWMGTTIACAQCHTHKYDPITQKEYFQLYDFFNQSADYDRPNESPLLEIYDAATIAKRELLESEIAAKEGELKVEPAQEDIDRWFVALGQKHRDQEAVELKGRFVRIDLPGSGKMLSLAEVQVFGEADGERKNFAIDGKAIQSSTDYGGPAKFANDGNTDGNFDKKSVTHTKKEKAPWWEVDLGGQRTIEAISVWHRTGGSIHERSNGFQVSVLSEDRKVVFSKKFENALATEQVVELQPVPGNILALLKKSEPLDGEGRTVISKYYLEQTRQQKRIELGRLRKRLGQIRPQTTVPIMEALAPDKHRTTKVQIRGNYLDTGEKVSAGTPSVFHDLNLASNGAELAKPNRMDLAKWLVDSNNPLTARVVVNRYWEQLFGIGLVETSEEFGAQGELPSHPMLLDWLAADLVENGWDTRRLLKQIVMSKTYQQSSAADSRSLDLDPNNRLLARGPRVRLTAEMIRDQALAISGLLSMKMYGPPVQPPQPKVGLKPAFSGQTTDWKDSVGEDRYRRGIYTEWRRSAPYPSMSTFDVNSREVCELRRSSTNTPLQALVTLNDPVYVEAAQALARRITANPELETTAARAKYALQLCVIREPKQSEVDRIVALYEQTKEHFAADETAAKELATDALNPVADDTNWVELAGWTTVANVLFNLDELLMKP